MDKKVFNDLLYKAAEQNSVSELINDSASEQMFLLMELLISENKKYNLTAIKEPSEIVYKHFIDSVVISKYIGNQSNVIDIGCGAGFPSLPLAIVRPDLKITALDSTKKKILFINLVCDQLKINNIATIEGRAEETAHNKLYRDNFDVSTARAVATFPVLSELCLPFVKPGGQFIALKGKFSKSEFNISPSSIGQLSASIPKISKYSLKIDITDEQRTLIITDKVGKTINNFPRKYSQITKHPLK